MHWRRSCLAIHVSVRVAACRVVQGWIPALFAGAAASAAGSIVCPVWLQPPAPTAWAAQGGADTSRRGMATRTFAREGPLCSELLTISRWRGELGRSVTPAPDSQIHKVDATGPERPASVCIERTWSVGFPQRCALIRRTARIDDLADPGFIFALSPEELEHMADRPPNLRIVPISLLSNVASHFLSLSLLATLAMTGLNFQRILRNRCPGCSYPVFGLRQPVCPECGASAIV